MTVVEMENIGEVHQFFHWERKFMEKWRWKYL